jgi:cellulose synthase/poly-beta-1,6-N-acetylglucosamine synthase-like glycosyltransferase
MSIVWILIFLSRKSDFFKKPRLNLVPSISVIIPTYNKEDTIGATIKSLLKVNYPRSIDIVVVNDGSTDRTAEILEKIEKKKKVRVITNDVNMGKGYSLNRALATIDTDLFACVDADSLVDSDCLFKMVGFFKDARVGAVTAALKVASKNNILERVQHVEYLLNLFWRKIMSFLDTLPVTPGVFSIYRTEIIKKLGGFDEKNLAEDMEIALRLHAQGYKVENCPDAYVKTFCPRTFNGLYKQRVRWYRGVIRNFIKYKKLFFNPKFGNLGIYFMPLNAIIVTFAVLFFLYFVTTSAYKVCKFFLDIFLINFDLSTLLNFELSIFSLGTSSLLLFLFLPFSIYLLSLSFNYSKEHVKNNILASIFFLFIFPFYSLLFWTASVFYEMFRVEKKW